MQERIAYQKLLKDFNRMEAATENLQDEVKCILKWIRHRQILKGISYGRSIETGEHLTRWRRPSKCREHGGGGRERLWQRLWSQQPCLHFGQVWISRNMGVSNIRPASLVGVLSTSSSFTLDSPLVSRLVSMWTLALFLGTE